jgi:hypothetical protein
MARLDIVLSKAFSDITRSDPNNGIAGHVVVDLAVKDFNPDDALFEFLGGSRERPFNDKAKKPWVTFATSEWRTEKNPLQLRTYFLFRRLADGCHVVPNHSASCQQSSEKTR